MKHLVHLSFPYYNYHALIVLNEAQRLIEEGNEIDILMCGGGVDRCYGNMTGDKSMCKSCIVMQKQWVKKLSPKYRVLYYKDFIPTNHSKVSNFEYSSPEDIKEITYKGVKIGYGAYSSYVSRTRNLNPLMDSSFRNFFNEILKTQCTLTDLLENYVNKESPDSVMVFSARHFEVRPFYDYPLAVNLNVMCLEAGFTLRRDVYMGFNYGKFQPHSIEFHNEFMLKQWEESTFEKKERIKIGQEFFERKRNNISAGGLVYTANQELGILPEKWDNNKRNIVIFNSSEDEFVAVGDEYSKKAFFPNQFIGINNILELLKGEKDIHIYIRVHPAQRNVQYKYHHDLYKLSEKYENVTVIKATEKVSSYTLIDHAEKIIVFGSTIGIEAVYWNKPVILLAGALYYYLDQCYIPKSIDELKDVLISKLEPKKSLNATIFGYYMLTERGYELTRLKLTRLKNFPFHPMKLNKESYFQMIKRFFLVRLFTKKEYKNHLLIPKIEE
jgi:hypothetical protein